MEKIKAIIGKLKILSSQPTCMWAYLSYYSGRQRRQWHPTPVLLPGKSHGWRSLEGCSSWGRWGLDTTEGLHFHFSLSCIGEGNGNPLQCSCLENPRDGGACWAAVYGVAQSRTRLKWLSIAYSGRSILTPTDGQLLCSDGKESTCNAGDLGLISGSGRTRGEGNGNFSIRKLSGESYGQRSLTSYSPRGCKESDDSATNTFTYFLLLFWIPFFSTFLRTSPFQFPSHLIFLGSFLSATSTLRNTKLSWLYRLPYFWLQFLE